jgi:hypothetical protein
LALETPSLSFSQCMGSSFRQTVAQILGDERMSESTMLASHTQAMVGLGTVQVRGVRQPNVLLMGEAGQPLGLLDQ